MKTIWFQDLKSKEDQANFKKMVLGSKIVLDKAIKIVYTKIKDGESSSLEDYTSPSWAYKQADKNGYVRALKEIIEILTVDDE